jgi:F-type H+-transporting ATPase subunit b
VAKQVVGRELKPEDHADLIRQALDRLPSNN